MTQTTLVPPDSHTKLPTTRDENAESGESYKRTIDKINAMFTGLFAAAGTTAIDFGAYPGTFDTSVDVTGQTAIVAGSNVQAWLVATATADHSIDEHWVDPPKITVGNISPGVGFTIYAIANDGGRNYGQWTVQWTWK
jgi:hypothetical protein